MKTSISDRQKVVLETMYKHYTNDQALEFVRAQGYNITERTLQRDRKVIKKSALPRLYQIAKIGFEDHFVSRIEKLDLIEKEMWKNYNEITDPYKRILSLERIANVQPIISAYYDSSRYVLEKSPSRQESDKSLSS